MEREFERVAPEEAAATSWLAQREAGITKGGGGRFGLHIVGVDLSDSDISDDDLPELARQLGSLSQLRTLRLAGTHITDRGVKHLCGLDSVEELDLSHTDISDAALDQLVCLPNIEYLDVSYTKVTAKGIGRLDRAPNLRMVALDGIGL